MTETVRALSKLLLVMALGACGAPGSDAVFTKGNPRVTPPESTLGAAARRPAASAPEIRRFEGAYRRLGEESRFQPCGTKVPLDIFGSFQARYLLHERFRWMAVQQGRRMYGVLHGAIVTDTPSVPGATGDSATPVPRTRFYLAATESLRTWQDYDCRGKMP